MKQPIRKAGIVSCSNGLPPFFAPKLQQLREKLQEMGIETVCSDYLYAVNGYSSGNAKERADALMNFYKDDSIDVIFDISGGDLANEILDCLDYDVIKHSKKEFWGYSDLTTILNAIYTKTGHTGVLWQVRNVVLEYNLEQYKRMEETTQKGSDTLFEQEYEFIQGHHMSGAVVGGNIRCLLKLAGTPYFPDITDKILLLEAQSGLFPQITAYFSQLKQMGVFEKVAGVILGTFTQMEKEQGELPVEEILIKFIPGNLPVAKTRYIGHGADARAIRIGEEIGIER